MLKDSLKPEERIMEAALETVKEKTISGIRMHHIAEKAEMAQSNLHYYYRTKEELLIALQKKVLKQCITLRKKFLKKADDTLESQLDVFIRQKKEFIITNVAYDFAEMDFWTLARVNESIKEGFVLSFENWRLELGKLLDRFAPNMDSRKREYLPFVMLSLLEGATIQYVNDQGRFDVDEYFEYCKEILIDIIEKEM